jgi:hypothetical protein
MDGGIQADLQVCTSAQAAKALLKTCFMSPFCLEKLSKISWEQVFSCF